MTGFFARSSLCAAVLLSHGGGESRGSLRQGRYVTTGAGFVNARSPVFHLAWFSSPVSQRMWLSILFKFVCLLLLLKVGLSHPSKSFTNLPEVTFLNSGCGGGRAVGF